MIPKVIHYCWFGRQEKDKLSQKCIASWKKKCPDYQIIEWNEDNYDLSKAPHYVRQAIDKRRWAFAVDYIRYDVIYHHGGIYLDTDVELIKTLDPFLINRCYFGIESNTHLVNSGLGFGAEKNHLFMLHLMKQYEDSVFLEEDMVDILNTKTDHHVFEKNGFREDGEEQMLAEGVHCYPAEYFSPFYPWSGKKLKRTKKTVSIHWYSLSWMDESTRKMTSEYFKESRRKRMIDLPNRIVKRALGQSKYEALKHFLKK